MDCKECGGSYVNVVDHFCDQGKPPVKPYWNCPKCGVMCPVGEAAKKHVCPVPATLRCRSCGKEFPQASAHHCPGMKFEEKDEACNGGRHRPGRWELLRDGSKLQGKACVECGLILETKKIPEAK